MGVAVWVGGQFVLAGIVPALRRTSPAALPVIANAFARIAWPAMILIVFTGVWALADIDATSQPTGYLSTFGIKLIFVAVAVVATVVHSTGQTKLAKALGGALGLSASVIAAYLGVLMAHAV